MTIEILTYLKTKPKVLIYKEKLKILIRIEKHMKKLKKKQKP